MSGFFSLPNAEAGRSTVLLRFERDLPNGDVSADTVELKVWRVSPADRFEPKVCTSSRILKTERFSPRRWGPFSWWTKVETKAPSGAGEKET